MIDRAEQARAEAERRWPGMWLGDSKFLSQHRAFEKGVEWADATPQPHTITRGELAHVSWMLQCLSEDRIAAVLPGLLGIEVEDDDE